MLIARRVVYTGRVQGVGFRYTAIQIAKEFQVAGWVKNLPDGSVEIQIKGERQEIQEILNTIRNESRVSDLISHSEETAIQPDSISQDSEFVVRH